MIDVMSRRRKFGVPGVVNNLPLMVEVFHQLWNGQRQDLGTVLRQAARERDALVMRYTANIDPDLLRTAEIRALTNPS